MPSANPTSARLQLHFFGPDWIATWARFDRARQRVEIVWFAAIVPYRRQTLYLAEIAGAKVRKRESRSGRTQYSLTLRRKIGEDVHLGCRSREAAMEMMRKISDFLELQ